MLLLNRQQSRPVIQVLKSLGYRNNIVLISTDNEN